MKFPFRIFANQNLGTQYDYTAFTGEWLSSHGVGQSPVLPEINVATGDVILKSPVIRSQDTIGDWEFGFVYHLQNPSGWDINIPKINSVSASALIFRESDGSLVTYQFDATQNAYVSPSGGASKSFITKMTDGTFVQCNPTSGHRTVFDVSGKITAQYDARGQSMQFAHDQNGLLQTIQTPAGIYTIERISGQVNFTFTKTNENTRELLGTWNFDSENRLHQAVIKGVNNNQDYAVSYAYDQKNQLRQIKQTDGTVVALNYLADKVSTLQVGTNGPQYQFRYHGDITTITDALGFTKTAMLDEAGRILSFEEAVGDTQASSNSIITSMNYLANGNLDNVIKPNNAKTQFVYNQQGLITQRIEPNGQRTEFDYDATNYYCTIKRVLMDDQTYAVTRYVYRDPARQVNNQTCRDLAFVISPTGCVTEYRYDVSGILASERTYLKNHYDLSALASNVRLTYSQMQTWASTQPANQIRLTTHQENARGQKTDRQCFTDINIDGTGKMSVSASHDQYHDHTRWGAAQSYLQKINSDQDGKDIFAETKKQYDQLQRIVSSKNALGEIQTIAHCDAKQCMIIKEPNDRTQTHQWNDAGQLISVITKVDTIARAKTLTHDAAGRIAMVTDSAGLSTYQLFDSMNRLRFSISAEGRVTEYYYDDVHRYQFKTQYFNALPMASFTPPMTVDWLQANLTKDPMTDVTTYQSRDVSGRLQFEVDGRGAVIEHRYDLRNREIMTIAYDAFLSLAELSAMWQGNLTKDPAQSDRVTMQFYDADSRVIATQDAMGYVTYFTRNPAGDVIYKRQYATRVALMTTGVLTLPAESPNDFAQYYYRDTKGNAIGVVDDVNKKNYVVAQQFLPTGVVKTKTAFANSSSIAPSLNRDFSSIIPSNNSEDQVTTHEYDALHRLIKQHLPNACLLQKKFDNMGHEIQRDQGDDPLQLSTTAKRYDAWGQLIAEATPLVCEKIAGIMNNTALTQDQKTQQIEAIWNTQARRWVYDNTTGLLTETIDIVPDDGDVTHPPKTFYFYDKDRRQVLSIGPEGQAETTAWHPVFEKAVTQRHYATAVDTSQLPQNNNGLITPAVSSLLTPNNNQDVIDQYGYDDGGDVSTHSDPDGYQTKTLFNAFGQWYQKSIPIHDVNPSLTETRAFNLRGQCTVETKTPSSGQPIVTTRAYQNLHGHCTGMTDGNQATTVTTYAPRGTVLTSTDPLNRTTSFEHDAFSRETKHTLPMGNAVAHTYVSANRAVIEDHLDASGNVLTSQSTVHDAFDRVISKTDAAGHVSTVAYNAAGDWRLKKDALGNTTAREHDLRGLLRSTQYTQAAGLFSARDEHTYNQSGEKSQTANDVLNLNLVTEYAWNALRQQTDVKTASKRLRKTAFNKRSLAVSHAKKVDDQTTVVTMQDYNGKADATSLTRSTTTQTKSYQEKVVHDDFGRVYQEIIDPNQLQLTTTHVWDNANRLIAEIDSNNHKKYFIRDMVGNIRFEINPVGGVTEHVYNAGNKPITTLQYHAAIDLTKISEGMSEAAVAALMTPSLYDRHTRYFYNAENHERFRVNRAGAVVETRYDANNAKIATIQYYQPVTDVASLSTASLTAFYEKNNDDLHDKATYRVLDAAGQEIFIIDADGSVTQKTYLSTLHQVNIETKYAKRITNPKQVAALSINAITALLQPCTEDRTTCWFVDGLNRLQFHVNAKGAVTRYDYEGDTKNRTQITVFAEAIANPTYANLLKLKPNSAVDNIETQTYDGAERLITRTNALGVSETFGYDGAGRQHAHTTLCGHQWTYDYDGANRLWQETSPVTTFYQASIDPNNVTAITVTATNQSVVKKTDYDQKNNVIGIHSGVGVEDERAVTFIYSALDQKTNDAWENLPIDDSSKPTSLTVRPEKTQAIAKNTVYGAQGIKLIELNEANEPTFFVYNAQHQLQYRINASGYVIEYQRNVFGECEQMIAYATALSLDLSTYLTTGLTPDVIAKNITPNSSADRNYYQTFNQKGELIALKRDAVVCYIPNADATKTPVVGKQTPTKSYRYNVFGESTAVTTVVDETSGISSQMLTWHDGLGNPVATVDSNGKAIVKKYDVNGQLIETVHYATFIPTASMPSAKTSFDDLHALLLPLKNPSKDLQTITPRDQIGRIKGIYHVGLVTQHIVAGQQAFADNPPALIGVTYTYTNDHKIKTITYPDGQVKIRYYDERRFLIAEADVVRTQQPSGNKIRPITYYHVSAHGERVQMYQPESGCAIDLDPNSETLPAPLQTSDQDKYHRFLRDARNHVLVKQDPENNLEQMTVTATGKIARKYHATTNPDKTHLDETQKTYDALDHLISLGVYRDGVMQHQIAYRHDAFHLIAEGPGDGTFPVQHRHDQVGRRWSTVDEKGGVQISGFNAAGDETVTVESTSLTNDLSTITDDDALLSLLQKRADVANFEFLETVRDAGRRPSAFVEPGYSDENNNVVRPTAQLVLDTHDKKIQSTTPNGETTTFERNPLSKVITQTDPAIAVMDEKGNVTTQSAVTKIGRDNQMKKIGVTDANGHTELFYCDEAEEVTSHTAADGVSDFKNTIDTFSRVIGVTDARGNTFQKAYNRKDKVTLFTLPSGHQWQTQLNENNFPTMVTPPAGSAQGITKYAQGPYGDLSARYLPMGEQHVFSHDRHHQELSHRAINIDGSLAYQTSSTRDYFGKQLTHIDGSGSQYKNTYYLNGMLYQELGVSVINHGTMPLFDSTIQSFPQVNNYAPMPLKKLTYAYLTRRRLHSISDDNTVSPQKLVKIFDINRNVTRITETNSAGRALRDTSMTFNARQLPVTQTDTDGFSLNYWYDLVTNRRRMCATYAGITHDGYWTFDVADRVLIDDGQMINGVIQPVFAGDFGEYAPSQGNGFTYENGIRATQSLYLEDSMGAARDDNALSAALTTNENGMIVRIDTARQGTIPAAGAVTVPTVVPALRSLDVAPITCLIGGSYNENAGCVDSNPASFRWSTMSGETMQNSSVVAVGGGKVFPNFEWRLWNGQEGWAWIESLPILHCYLYLFRFAINGMSYQAMLQTFLPRGGAYIYHGFSYPINIQWTPDGLLRNTSIDLGAAGQFILHQNAHNSNGFISTYFDATFDQYAVNVFSGFSVDGAPIKSVLTTISGTPTAYNPGPTVTQETDNVFYLFDSLTIALATTTRTDQYGKNTRAMSFAYDANTAYTQSTGLKNPFNPKDKSINAVYFDNSLDRRLLCEWYVAYGSSPSTPNDPDVYTPIRLFHDTKGNIVATHGPIVNLHQTAETVLQITANPVQPLRMTDLLNGATNVVIQPGDTWQSLSNRAFRDPAYASILHAYSGTPLIPGQTINLVQTLSAYNKAHDYTPYERFMNVVYNSLNNAVQTPEPPPPKPHHESFWDELIGAVVAVAVMIFVPEAAASLLFGVTSLFELGSAGLAVSYAVAGALASATTQGVAIAFDDQHGFSISSMVENAIASGATAGLSRAMNVEKLLQEDQYVEAFAQSVSIGATVQAYQLALGLRDQFDLKVIFEQAAGTLLQTKINAGMSKTSAHVTNVVDELENTAVDAAFGGKIDLTTLAGNCLGNEAADDADLIAQHFSQSHHTTSIGKPSAPSSFSDHARAAYADSQFMPALREEEGGIGDLYAMYDSGLSGDVNAMAETDFDTAQASVHVSVEHHRAVRVQQTATQPVANPSLEARLSQDLYENQNRWWARGILGITAGLNSNAMHIVVNGLNGFTRDAMHDVAGNYGSTYFDALQNGTSTFSEAAGFYSATAVSAYALAETGIPLGSAALKYGARFAEDVLPSVGRNIASMFGRGGVADPIEREFGEAVGVKSTQLFRIGTEGIEPASTELLQAIQNKGRTIVIAKPGSEEYRYLEYLNAEANVGGSDLTHILLKENPSKPALLEEFLHGTQQKLGIVDRLGTQGAEVHVKDFMIRHQKLLGLGQQDVNILQKLLDRDVDLLAQMNRTSMRRY